MDAEADVTLTGRVARYIYRDDIKGFGIARLSTDDGSVVVKGPVWGVEEGERVEVIGRWQHDPKFGKQLRAQTVRPLLPVTVDGISAYLARASIHGVGKKVAQRIADKFGDDTLRVIREEPERLKQVSGIGKKRATAIAQKLQVHLARAESQAFLLGLGLGPAVVRRIYERFGDDAVRTVRERPYRLVQQVHGVGFATADQIARQQGIDRDAPERMDAAVLHVLESLAGHGHTAPLRLWVVRQAAELIGVDAETTASALSRLVEAGQVRAGAGADDGRDWVAQRRLYEDEMGLADDLQRLAGSHAAKMTSDAIDARLELAAQALGFGLAGTQRDAVVTALHAGLMVITGGPGTGKTTIIQGLLAGLAPDECPIALAAPTGRAARRLTETTLREAHTVHRLLEYDPRENAFGRHREHPLAAELVIVDESSMLDVQLAAALCAAIAPGARLLLVGDADQLPSVGPGSVLGDVIGSDTCPVVRLDHIYRQADRSQIVKNAHAVRQGKAPQGSRDPASDFFVIGRENPEDIVQTVLEVVCQRLPGRYGYDPVDDIQVLVPIHRGPIGTQAFNRELRSKLNPHGGDVGGGFRVGDKVIQVRNNYDLEIQNGDVGRIVGPADGGICVRFGKREVTIPKMALEDLQLAYAITVHKSQGSEYPAVVMPIHSSHRLLLQRNLLYTAITRARRFAVLIGQGRAITTAVSNARAQRRQTLLQARLRERTLAT